MATKKISELNAATALTGTEELPVVQSGSTVKATADQVKTFVVDSPQMTTPEINDTSGNHQYVFAVNELSADRTVTLPLLTGNDTFVFQAHAQTLTNKTILAASNTLDARVEDIAGLTASDGGFIVGDGSNFVVESGATARTSLGLAIGTDVQAYDADLAAIAGLTSAANKVIRYTGSATADLLDFLDEDNMSSDSATAVASQQSIKAYVDTQVAAKIVAGTPIVQNPFAINTSVTQAHGLSAAPSFIQVEMECLTAEQNYSIGDKIFFSLNGNSAGASGKMDVVFDATNLTVVIPNASFGLINKTTFAQATLTPANWKLTITPYLVT